MRLLLFALALAAPVSAPAPAAAAEPAPWTVTEIASSAGTTRIRPAAVNSSYVVVGTARFPGRQFDTAFRWEDGTMTELPVPPGKTTYESWAHDINDKGVIVGGYTYELDDSDDLGESNQHAMRWADGAYVESTCCVGTAGPAPNTYGAMAYGINELGQITGNAWSGEDSNAVLWEGGAFTNLGPPGAEADGSVGYEINESGAVVGHINIAPVDRGALYAGGTRTILEVDPGRNGLNDLGHVVGNRPYMEGKNQIARLWDGQTYTDLAPEGEPSQANAVNDAGWAVGRSGVPSHDFWGGTAMLWRPGEAPVTLNSLAGWPWILRNATDITADGTIVGRGVDAETNAQIGFLLAPAGLAYELTGTVTDGKGAPVPGVEIRASRSNGESAGTPVKTDAEGKYRWTLARGDYRITALPEGTYAVAVNPDCTIDGFHCHIAMTRNRTVDFRTVAPEVTQPLPETGGGSAQARPAADLTGPVVAFAKRSLKLKVDRKGTVRFPLPAVAEAVSGTIELRSGRTSLGRAAFALAAGPARRVRLKLTRKARNRLGRRKRSRAVARVVARDTAGNATKQTLKVVLTR